MSETSLFSPPDLQIIVRQDHPGELSFEVRSDLLGFPGSRFDSLSLTGDTKSLVDELSKRIDEISDLAAKGQREQADADRKLRHKAVALFKKLPKPLRMLLWSNREGLETVQILSDEPYIPWEIMKLQGENGEEGPFLCEAFSVTRWLRAMEIPQTTFELPLRSVALVMPRESELPSSEDEKKDLAELLGADHLLEVEPSFRAVTDALTHGDYDAWHFSGHGSARSENPDEAQLWLDGEDFLTPENLASAEANLRRFQPLIFLNGCDTGRGGLSLSGLGGWAHQSLASGAGGFIGTLWPVRDKKARAFAGAFYKNFTEGLPIGEAVRRARLHVRDQFPGDPAWLAYTVYAHPGAVRSGASRALAQWESRLSPLHLPALEWRPEVSPPGALVRAEYGIVPFHGRDKERDDLQTWCMDSTPVRVRLYTGPGGMGKTRLALEMAKALRQEGWRAGLLQPKDDVLSVEDWKTLCRPGGKVLAIIDYAETRRKLLVPLLSRLYATDNGPIRIILLARAALDWWEQLKVERDGVGELVSGPATDRLALTALAMKRDQRAESYQLAGQAFARKLSLDPVQELPEDLDQSYYERVLLLHMSALAAVQGEAAKGESGVLDHILLREVRYLRDRAADRKLAHSLLPGIRRAMAAITLGGGVRGETEAVEVLKTLQAFSGQTGTVLLEVARLLHESYPGTSNWIEPVLPDLLGEHLIQRELEAGAATELFSITLGDPQ